MSQRYLAPDTVPEVEKQFGQNISFDLVKGTVFIGLEAHSILSKQFGASLQTKSMPLDDGPDAVGNSCFGLALSYGDESHSPSPPEKSFSSATRAISIPPLNPLTAVSPRMETTSSSISVNGFVSGCPLSVLSSDCLRFVAFPLVTLDQSFHFVLGSSAVRRVCETAFIRLVDGLRKVYEILTSLSVDPGVKKSAVDKLTIILQEHESRERCDAVPFVALLLVMSDLLPVLANLSLALQMRDAVYNAVGTLVMGAITTARSIKEHPGQNFQHLPQAIDHLTEHSFRFTRPKPSKCTTFRSLTTWLATLSSDFHTSPCWKRSVHSTLPPYRPATKQSKTTIVQAFLDAKLQNSK
ncbi:hypothetical protein MAR_026206 [Mya arenaria]|uniref:Uncharacterized protein n=1 Tax=Mya arenaria TaxID=6604 RepID=A0ABY7EXX2_MYAAR|nr:hypothetical protein MAR_026206 [Mya arenaria]